MKKTLYSFENNTCFGGNLAIFCSDERFVEANLSFLKDYLKIKRIDLIVLPGGPEFLINDEPSLLDRIKILVKAHQIKKIILISHSECGYYNARFDNFSKEEILKKQLDDTKKAIQNLKKIFDNISVCGFYAYIIDSKTIKYAQI